MNKKFKKIIQNKIQILEEEQKKAQNGLDKHNSIIKELEIVKHRIDGSIFTLNDILKKDL